MSAPCNTPYFTHCKYMQWKLGTLGDFRNISTIFIFLLAVPPYNFAILTPKWCKYPILGSKTNRGDIRLYFKTYEKIARWRRC